MADTKITGLAAATTIDLDNDLLEIVDVSDTSMDAGGTNKKAVISHLLGLKLLASAAPSGASSVLFSGLPQTAKHLLLVCSLCNSTGSEADFGCYLNGDTGSNYSRGYMHSVGASASAGSTAATNFHLGVASAAGSAPAVFLAVLANYTSAKIVGIDWGGWSGSPQVMSDYTSWAGSGPLTSVEVFAAAGTITGTIDIYGL